MREIDSIRLPAGLAPRPLWREMAAQAGRWLVDHDLAVRDAVVLLPFAELLPPCRQALAALGGWQPRVETLRTLVASLGPEVPAPQGAPTGDVAVDRWVADQWLRRIPAMRAWRQRDRLAYRQALADVVDAAHALMKGASRQAQTQRDAWWARAQGLLAAADAGVGSHEAALMRLVLPWAALAVAPAADRLAALRPSAWIVIEAGGPDPVVQRLVDEAAQGGVPVLVIQADPPASMAFEHMARVEGDVRLVVADSPEQEAWAAASEVIDAVNAGDAPVALIAHDRLLVRRVRALLERAGLRIADESGWTLSTTRAASHLMALLRAAQPASGPDAWLDALKSVASAVEAPHVDLLERRWRRQGGARVRKAEQLEAEARSGRADAEASRDPWRPNAEAPRPGDPADDPPDRRWWRACRASWQRFAEAGTRPLSQWLADLDALTDESLPAAVWHNDPAAAAVRSAMRLDSAGWPPEMADMVMDLEDFVAWVQEMLEQGSYIAPVGIETAQVVITPPARAMLRPFGAVVFPGTDEGRLGLAMPGPSLLADAAMRALGLDDRERRQERAALGFVQLLRHERLRLVRRRSEGKEPLGPSPWWLRLQGARRRADCPAWPELAARFVEREVPCQPQRPPAPGAARALPQAVSASAVETLRSCPYRFFALVVLGLSTSDELEADPGKRDYGTLLHEILQRFHDQRGQTDVPGDDRQHLRSVARQAASSAGLDGSAMLPFSAGLETFVERYLHWLQEHEAAGWRYRQGEVDLKCPAPAPGAPGLSGRVDRIDEADGGRIRVLDYKTGHLQGLKARVRQPLEDTQLAFYAAQWISRHGVPAALSAAYLALDDRDAIVEVEHREVDASAKALIEGLAQDWQRMAHGMPLLALGAAATCDHCDARGLCRRDHWDHPRPTDGVQAP